MVSKVMVETLGLYGPRIQIYRHKTRDGFGKFWDLLSDIHEESMWVEGVMWNNHIRFMCK